MLKFCAFLLAVYATSTDAQTTANILLTRDGRLVPEYQFAVPRQYLSQRIAAQISSRGTATVESLYLTPTTSELSEAGKTPSGKRSPDGETIHIFLRLVSQPMHRDSGKWRFDRAMKDASRRAVALEEVKQLSRGRAISIYEIPGAAKTTLYKFDDQRGRTVFVRCWGRTCQGYKTWNGEVVMEYRYPSDLSSRVVELDSQIEAFVASIRSN